MEGDNAIFSAVKGGASRRELEELLEAGADFGTPSENEGSILHAAAKVGNLEAISYFISRGVHVDVRNLKRRTPLMEAVFAKDNFLSVVTLLLDHGAQLNSEDVNRDNLILLATHHERPVKELEALLDLGADWGKPNQSGDKPLHIAAKNGDLEGVIFFISKGAHVNHRNVYGATPLILAVQSKKKFLAVAELLIKQGADCGVRDLFENTVLHLAAERGEVEAVKLFLSQEVDVNARNKMKETPLLSAATAKKNFMAMVDLLIKNGADITAVDKNGANIVSLAFMHGKPSTQLEQLVERGMPFEMTGDDGCTMAHLAAEWGNLDVLHDLIASGVNVNVRDSWGKTPLLSATKRGGEHLAETVDLLVETGADVNAVDEDGNNAVLFAVQAPGTTLEDVKKLVELGCQWWLPNWYGDTVLQKVKAMGNNELYSYLTSLPGAAEAPLVLRSFDNS